jgi:hypothetical protein
MEMDFLGHVLSLEGKTISEKSLSYQRVTRSSDGHRNLIFFKTNEYHDFNLRLTTKAMAWKGGN